MQQHQAIKLFSDAGAILTYGHFVYASWQHGNTYIDKDAIYAKPRTISELCKEIAIRFYNGHAIDTVIGPAMGGVILSQWVAYHLTIIQERETAAVFAEKSDTATGFTIRPSYEKHIRDKWVLVVEDQLTTGNSASKVVQTVRNMKGNVIGLGALWNRGGVTEMDVGNVPFLKSLINKRLDSWKEGECPLCLCDSPVNEKYGRGKEFMKRKRQLQ